MKPRKPVLRRWDTSRKSVIATTPKRAQIPAPAMYVGMASTTIAWGGADDGGSCICEPGTVRDCGPTTNMGACEIGSQTCQGVGMDARWTTCVGAVMPDDEVCNGADDDCDGSADEGFADIANGCVNGSNEPGTTSCGVAGTRTCVDCQWTPVTIANETANTCNYCIDTATSMGWSEVTVDTTQVFTDSSPEISASSFMQGFSNCDETSACTKQRRLRRAVF